MIRRRILFGIVFAVLFGIGWGVGRGRAGGDLYRNLDMFVEVLHAVQTSYVDPVDPRPLIEGGMHGMLRSLDPYSDYLTPHELDAKTVSLAEDFEGVVISSFSDPLKKYDLAPSSPVNAVLDAQPYAHRTAPGPGGHGRAGGDDRVARGAEANRRAREWRRRRQGSGDEGLSSRVDERRRAATPDGSSRRRQGCAERMWRGGSGGSSSG